jgi:GxxExxY protein
MAAGPHGNETKKKVSRKGAKNAKGYKMTENEIARVVVDAAYHVHKALGPGLMETVYEVVLTKELCQRGMKVERQRPIPIEYEGLKFEEGFRADMVVEDLVMLELKSVESIARVQKKQLLTYLRLSNKRLGLLINFGEEYIKDGISRVVNGLPDS